MEKGTNKESEQIIIGPENFLRLQTEHNIAEVGKKEIFSLNHHSIISEISARSLKALLDLSRQVMGIVTGHCRILRHLPNMAGCVSLRSCEGALAIFKSHDLKTTKFIIKLQRKDF